MSRGSRVRMPARIALTLMLAATAVGLVARKGSPAMSAQEASAPASDLVSVTVRVVDTQTGLAPAGLTPEDFDLRVDEAPAPIRAMTDRPGPLRLAILVDLSHSANMRESGIAALLARALDRVLFTTLDVDDRVRIGALGRRMTLTPFLGDRAALVNAVNDAMRLPEEERYGPSPLWDQVDEVTRSLASEPSRRAILLLSDGRATGNRIGVGAAGLRAAISDVIVSTIGEASSGTILQGDTIARISPDAGLRSLASTTGGLFTPGTLALPRRGADLLSFDPAPEIERVIRHLRDSYVIRFASPVRDGNIHSIEVRMQAPNLTAAARQFYRAARGESLAKVGS